MAEIINWYDKIGANNKKKKLPKKWKDHHIHHNSMILCVGPTGSGKTNSLMDYISRSNGEFYKIIINSFNTTDEPLYNHLKEKSDRIEFYDNIEEMPDLAEFEDDKDKPKLLVIDDFINLTKKEQKKIFNYIISGRKFGFSVWLMAQSYINIDKLITRNINYFLLYKINDNVSIDRIIRNHNIDNVDPELFKKAYQLSTREPLSFMIIDLKSKDKKDRHRHGFLNFLKLKANDSSDDD
jgi:hypothetical protein